MADVKRAHSVFVVSQSFSNKPNKECHIDAHDMMASLALNFASFKVLSFLYLFAVINAESIENNSNPFRRSEILDLQGKYLLEWGVDWIDKGVTFNVTVKTKGYVGFGLSLKGKMSGADIVIGGVLSNGNPYFSDRHAVGNQLPVEDIQQDWTLHKAWENETHTFLSFSRPFETCDEEHDLPIQEHSITVIWAYGEKDDDIQYHFQNRGTFKVYILDPDLTPQRVLDAARNKENLKSLGDWKVWTISKTQAISSQETTYYCTFHKPPRHNRKQHIVGFRTILESDLERRHIHHYLLHRCYPPRGVSPRDFFDQYVNRPAKECYVLSLPSSIPADYCREVMHEWAVGGIPIFFPDHVGIPMSETPDEYYMFQVHYDNPEMLPNIELNFSLEIYYTDQLREHDAGVLYFGHGTPGSPSIMLPSHEIDHLMYGHCGSGCTNKMFPPEGINVFASKLHTHLAGTAARVMHVRGNRELPYMLNDDNYLFDYQPIRVHRHERTVLPGDAIIKRCLYATTDRNGSATIGGFSTRSEMCNGFIWYYPYIRDTLYGSCSSEIRADVYREFLQIYNTTWSDELIENVVTSPPINSGLTTREVGTRIDWTIEKRNQLRKYHEVLPHVTSCPDIGPDAVERERARSDLVTRRPKQRSGRIDDSAPLNEFPSVLDDRVVRYKRPNVCSG